MDVINFMQVSESLASSGQPSKEDFGEIAKQGYQTVINLALSSSDNAVPHEGDIVTALRMSYVHIPVQWKNPTVEQFVLFAAVMQQAVNAKVWVHCALNMRVSAFLYLYNLIFLDEPEEFAAERMHKIWKPNQAWQLFIDKVKAEVDPSSLFINRI